MIRDLRYLVLALVLACCQSQPRSNDDIKITSSDRGFRQIRVESTLGDVFEVSVTPDGRVYSFQNLSSGIGTYVGFSMGTGTPLTLSMREDGIHNGIAIAFYSSGGIERVEHNQGGVLNGPASRRLAVTGQLSEFGSYKGGKKHGVWMYRRRDGTFDRKMEK